MLAEEFCLFSNKIRNGDEYCRLLHQRIIHTMQNKQPLPVVRFADGEYAFYNCTLGCNGLYQQAESVETIKRVMPLHITAMEYLAVMDCLRPLFFQAIRMLRLKIFFLSGGKSAIHQALIFWIFFTRTISV